MSGRPAEGGLWYRPGPPAVTRLAINSDVKNAATTVDWWLFEGPWHPLWHQFILGIVRLADVEGMPPAHLQFPGATHELFVLAVNPDHPVTQAGLESGEEQVRRLEPIDVVHQFTATDAEMYELGELLAEGVRDGHLTPSTDDARERLREQWLRVCVKTLAHMRGEEHAP